MTEIETNQTTEPDPNPQLGRRIDICLQARGWKRSDLCRKVEGLTPQALKALIDRNSKISEYQVEIADALEVSLRWLLAGPGAEPVWLADLAFGVREPGPETLDGIPVSPEDRASLRLLRGLSPEARRSVQEALEKEKRLVDLMQENAALKRASGEGGE